MRSAAAWHRSVRSTQRRGSTAGSGLSAPHGLPTLLPPLQQNGMLTRQRSWRPRVPHVYRCYTHTPCSLLPSLSFIIASQLPAAFPEYPVCPSSGF